MRIRYFIGLAAIAVATTPAQAGIASLSLTPESTYATGVFDESAAEIVVYDPGTRRAFVVNANAGVVDVLSLGADLSLTKVAEIDADAAGGPAGKVLGAANSVAVKDGLVAVAIEADTKTDNGIVAFYAADSLALLNTVEVGALPDMLTFTPDGERVLVANEGEPNDDYTVDPEGSVSIIDLRRGVHRARVKTAHFRWFDNRFISKLLVKSGVRIFGPGASVSQDLEPEYITISDDGRVAWVALQENNALARVNIRFGVVTGIYPLGYKDHSLPGNAFDPSDRDSGINIASWPVLGMYQPDAIAAYTADDGKTYIVMANEGDARDYDGFAEETSVDDGAMLDPSVFTNGEEDNASLGRLTTTTVNTDTNGDGLIDVFYAFGARSFSIVDGLGRQVFDSGSDFEDITANAFPDFFNASNTNNNFENRSDNKGPEPEAVAIARFGGTPVAFIALERIGGVMAYDISDPRAPVFLTYVNNRDFTQDVETPEAGDLGPEGIAVISAAHSPTGQPLLLVANEISGTTTVFSIDVALAP